MSGGIWFPLFTPSIHYRTKPAAPVNTRGVLSCSCFSHHPPVACISVTTKLFECNKEQDTYIYMYIHIYISIYLNKCPEWVEKKTPESTSLLCQSMSELQVRRQRQPNFVFYLKHLSKFRFLN